MVNVKLSILDESMVSGKMMNPIPLKEVRLDGRKECNKEEAYGSGYRRKLLVR